jgi:ATP-dependent DNA helicase RecG
MRTPVGFSGVDPPDDWSLSRSAPRPERLELGVDVLPGVGPTVANRLAKLGARTVRDLLWHRPARYEAAAPERRVVELFGEDEATIEGIVRSVRTRRVRRRLTIVTAHVADGSGGIDAVWFNQEWLADKLEPGTRVRLRGSLGRRGEFAVKSYDIGEASATADHVPVYPATEDLQPKRVRTLVEAALAYVDDVPDALPAALRVELELPLARDAVAAVHRGATDEEAEVGRRRLAFDELLELQLALALVRRDREDALAPALGEPVMFRVAAALEASRR